MDDIIKGTGTSADHNGKKFPHNSQHNQNKTKQKHPSLHPTKKRLWWGSEEWQINERPNYEKFKILKNINLRENQAKQRSLKRDNKYKHSGNRLTNLTILK